jgi:hypothetical protein
VAGGGGEERRYPREEETRGTEREEEEKVTVGFLNGDTAQDRRDRPVGNPNDLNYTEAAIDLRRQNETNKGAMLATLIIPSSEGVSQTYPLHLEFFEGHPALFSSHGHTISRSYFELLRDRMGARIETDDVPVVAGILGLPSNEPGLSATF